MGMVNGSAYERVVSGYFPVDKITQLESVAGLQFVQPAYTPLKSVGLVTSQGDVALKADVAKSVYGVTGAGSKIGILSDTYNALGGAPAGVASGDLPAGVQVLSDLSSGADEGRGMAELVHDIAPGANIAFNTAFTGQAGFANGIKALANAGCNIIVDDVLYFAEPFFQDGIIAQAVDEVVKNKVTYFSAAGNNANTSYENTFNNTGIVVPGWGVAHDFGNGDIKQTFTIAPFGSFRVILQWDDPFYSVSGGAGAKTDLDLLVYINGALTFASASDNLGGDPVEGLFLQSNSPTPVSVEIVITKYAGPDPGYIKWVHFGNGGVPTFIEHDTKSSTCVGHANAEGAIAVGASAYFNTPAFNANLSTAVINSYSSKGGDFVFIKKDGKKTGRGQGKRRDKPEITAVDGTNTTFFGSDISQDADAFPNFFGTSAAAPHAAAVAALMQEAKRNKLNPANVLSIMRNSALDMDDPETPGFDKGFDYRTGAGLIQADRCVDLAGGKLITTTSRLTAPENELTPIRSINISPNPTRGLVNIALNSQLSNGVVEIFNSVGALVYKQNITKSSSQNLRVNLGSQAPGIYFIKIKDARYVKTTKILLNK